MAEVRVNSVQPSEASKEMVALYLFASVATARGATVNIREGIPYVDGGMTAKEIMTGYIDALYAVRLLNPDTKKYIQNLPD